MLKLNDINPSAGFCINIFYNSEHIHFKYSLHTIRNLMNFFAFFILWIKIFFYFRYTSSQFSKQYHPTTGVDFYLKRTKLPGKKLNKKSMLFKLWFWIVFHETKILLFLPAFIMILRVHCGISIFLKSNIFLVFW